MFGEEVVINRLTVLIRKHVKKYYAVRYVLSIDRGIIEIIYYTIWKYNFRVRLELRCLGVCEEIL
jgi:hypothetical protein